MGFDQYWDYGEEHQTASANYRPRDSNTALRKPRQRIREGQSAQSQSRPKQSQPEESPSFYKNEDQTLNKGPLIEFSGSDKPGSDEEAELMGKDRTQKSLEREFDQMVDQPAEPVAKPTSETKRPQVHSRA